MTNTKYQSAGEVFDGWRDDVLTGLPPVLIPIGAGDLARIEIGPGLVTLFGGIIDQTELVKLLDCLIDSAAHRVGQSLTKPNWSSCSTWPAGDRCPTP